MKRPPRAGFLPLYLELYDDAMPEARAQFGPWVAEVTKGLLREGIDLVPAKVCRSRSEFEEAVRGFDAEDVDVIITLHLAYSLSLESIDALAAAGRPILLLDTTMDEAFGPDVDPARILFNHGVHGVQDLSCMLRRRGVPYEVVAGHVRRTDPAGRPNVLRRAAEVARAALAARILRETRALRVGEAFEGMGDFAVADRELERCLGVAVEEEAAGVVAALVAQVGDAEVDAEVRRDLELYDLRAPEDVHRRSVRVGLGLRRLLDQGGYGAFSLNFLAFDSSEGPLDTVPFLEISKAMARGLGYAGEGDVLTAALVGALSRAFGRTTFTEIFCPDWEGGSLFISHMGEINPEVAAARPTIEEKDFPWTAALSPAVLACAPAPGPATLVNLAPGPDKTFRIVHSSVEVLGDSSREDMRQGVRGWIRPAAGVEEFLERYSRLGGTHHSALVLGDHAEAVRAFAAFAGIEAREV